MRLRCSAASALAKVGDDRAIIPMMSILNNREENYRLRLAVAESLGRLGDEYAVKPLIDILSDEREKSLYLKESAAKALGMLGDIRAIEPLIDMLESKRGIRDKFNFLKEQIIEAVGRIGRPNRKATDSLILALQDEAPSIRLAAIEALSVIGDESCLEALKACILDENDEVAKAVVYAVYRLGGEQQIRELLLQENLPRFLREELDGYIP
jgi:HEAT repeat protein